MTTVCKSDYLKCEAGWRRVKNGPKLRDVICGPQKLVYIFGTAAVKIVKLIPDCSRILCL